MIKTKVVFLGSRPLGYAALNLLQSLDHVEVVAVVARNPSSNTWWENDPFHIANKLIISHDDIFDMEFDFGISINYWKVLEPEIVRKPRLGFINLHHSYNLCLRGRNMATRAILSSRPLNRWYHGTSLHYTDDGLDTGPIIASKSCTITEFDTSWTLFNKTERLGKELLDEWLPRLTQAKVPAAYPELNHPLSLRIDDFDRCIANIHYDPLHTYDIVRAFDFKCHYEQAFTYINGERFYLTTDKKFADEVILKIDSNRIVYSIKKM